MNTNTATAFVPFPKMARLSRDIIITEKLDGTNACVHFGVDGEMLVGSRTRWITSEDDNFGFARWCAEHEKELRLLGPGTHFGEWWGRGIQRNYGLSDRRFSLFNVSRWCLHGTSPEQIPCADPRIQKSQEVLPACVGLVPVLWRGHFDMAVIADTLDRLQVGGSIAAPGFMKPEGVVVWHTAANIGFKKTIGNDGAKGAE